MQVSKSVGRPSREGRGLKFGFGILPEDAARRPSREGRGLKFEIDRVLDVQRAGRPSREGRGLK